MTKEEKTIHEKLTQHLQMVEQKARTQIIENGSERGVPDSVIDAMLDSHAAFMKEAFELWEEQPLNPNFETMLKLIEEKHLSKWEEQVKSL